MAIFKPFCALRPCAGAAKEVAALPYDVVDRYEARSIGEANPHSFLHIDRAEMDLDPSLDIYSPQVYEKARENLQGFEKEGLLVMEKKPCFYIYELERQGKVQTGVAGCASIDDYLKDTVKKHELTREDKELDRIHHVDACDANTGPIYLAARYPKEMKELLAAWKKAHPAAYDFTEEDGISHRVWVIDEAQVIEELEKGFDRMGSFYISDGHHRAASAVKVGLLRRQQHPDYRGDEEFNYFLSVVFPYDELTILAYHRIVKDLHGLTVAKLLSALEKSFEIEKAEGEAKVDRRHSFGLYVDGSWYDLRARDSICQGKDVVGSLDVSILQEEVLSPLLGICDPRTDERIRFVGGSHSLADLAREVDEKGGLAFAMYPTSMEELMQIADASLLMPPKSTWFEPKLRSGIFIHKLS